MELSWLSRIKIALVLALGGGIFGIMGWPYVRPADPMGAFTLVNMNAQTIAIFGVISFILGFAAYFLAWPWGRHIGILAVPAGLGAWALRSGTIHELLRVAPGSQGRQGVYSHLLVESLVWCAFAVIGYAGVLAACKLFPSKALALDTSIRQKPRSAFETALGFVAAVVIAMICLAMFAQNVNLPDEKLGTVVNQPRNFQIACAAILAFGIAAFVVKRFMGTSYIWPALATVVVSVYAMKAAAAAPLQQYMAATWPSAFFASGSYAVLPVQMVSFGIIGSVTGYWLAVRFQFWSENQA